MAKKKAHEYAQEVLGNDEYLKEVLSLIPAEKAEPMLSRLGERIMARDEFSRSMDELRSKEEANAAYKGTLDNWFQEKVTILSEGEKAKEELAKLKGGQQQPASDALKSLEGYIKKDEHEKIVLDRIRQSEEAGLSIFSTLTRLASSHLHEYGEVLDPDALIGAARKAGKDISSAYLDFSSDLRQKKEEKRSKEEREKLKEQLREELMKERGHGVFPVAADPGIPSTLSGLASGANDGKSNRIASAIDDFSKNAASRRAS